MIRVTTPTHIFKLPTATSNLQEVIISYAQNNQEVLSKHLSDCTAEGNKLTVKLTQAEPKLFVKGNVQIQIRVKTNAGSVFASTIFTRNVDDVLNDVVI